MENNFVQHLSSRPVENIQISREKAFMASFLGTKEQNRESENQQSQKQSDKLNLPSEDGLKKQTARIKNQPHISFDQLERKLLDLWDLVNLKDLEEKEVKKASSVKKGHNYPSLSQKPLPEKRNCQTVEKKSANQSRVSLNFSSKTTQKQFKSRNHHIQNQGRLFFDSSSQSPQDQSKKQFSESQVFNLQSKLRQQSKHSLSKEQQKILKEGFQVSYRDLMSDLFKNFKTTFNYLLLSYLGQEQTKNIMQNTLYHKDLRINKSKVLELMKNSELQTFWSIVFRHNAISRVFLKISKSTYKTEYSKLTYLFEYMFENQRLQNYYVKKDKLLQAAKELKAMRDNGQLPNKALENKSMQRGGSSAESQEFIAQALGRNIFNIELFLDRFKKILLKIVKDGIADKQIDLTPFSQRRIEQTQKKQGLSMKDCNFLMCRWEFCKIWPQAFEQNLIESMYSELISQKKINLRNVQENKIMSVLFQKAYLEGKLTNVYTDQNLLLKLANRIQYENKDPYFEKMPKQFWESFDSEELKMKRQQQQQQDKKEMVNEKQRQIYQRKSRWNTKKKTKINSVAQIAFKRFESVFRMLKQRKVDKLIAKNPGKGYEELLKTRKFNLKLSHAYMQAFKALFRQTLTNKQINQDSNLKKVIQQYEMSTKDYYLVLFHPHTKKTVRSVFGRDFFIIYQKAKS